MQNSLPMCSHVCIMYMYVLVNLSMHGCVCIMYVYMLMHFYAVVLDFHFTASVEEWRDASKLEWQTLQIIRKQAQLAIFYKFHHSIACINSKRLPSISIDVSAVCWCFLPQLKEGKEDTHHSPSQGSVHTTMSRPQNGVRGTTVPPEPLQSSTRWRCGQHSH